MEEKIWRKDILCACRKLELEKTYSLGINTWAKQTEHIFWNFDYFFFDNFKQHLNYDLTFQVIILKYYPLKIKEKIEKLKLLYHFFPKDLVRTVSSFLLEEREEKPMYFWTLDRCPFVSDLKDTFDRYFHFSFTPHDMANLIFEKISEKENELDVNFPSSYFYQPDNKLLRREISDRLKRFLNI